MLNIYNNIITVIEASGTIPLTITEIRRHLGSRGIDIQMCHLSGYLHSLNDLERVAYIPTTDTRGGYLSITAYWRLIGKRYHDVMKTKGDENPKW